MGWKRIPGLVLLGMIQLTGMAILGVGIYMAVDEHSGQFASEVVSGVSPLIVPYSHVFHTNVFSLLAYLLIAIGSLTALTSLLACVGAIWHKRRMLGISFGVQMLIFLALVGLGIYVYMQRDQIEVDKDNLRSLLRNNLIKAVQNYHSDSGSKKYMEAIQNKYHCCGANNGGADYAPLLNMPCELLYADRPCLPPYYEDVHQKIGVTRFFTGRMTIGLASVLALGSILLLNLILTLIMLISARNGES